MSGLNKFNLNKIDPDHRLRTAAMKTFSFLPDAAYLKFVYKMRTGHSLNLDEPKDFTEKLHWLKLHDKHPEYTQLVDKLEVRKIVEEKIGPGYSFPLLGHWEHFDDIDFNSLPNKFVLKCNHDSGSYKIITDKSALTPEDYAKLKKHFDRQVKGNPFYAGREYPYKNVKACILAEQFMEPQNGEDIMDYKFFCFNGVPKLVYVMTDHHTNSRMNFFDMDFNPLDIQNIDPRTDKPIEKPACFDEMKEIAAKLSAGIRHVRIDLYEMDGKIYFGEFTFFHGGGFVRFKPDEWERRLGDWIEL